MVKPVNDSICPLCKQSNRCDAKSSNGCWCMSTQVPAALLAKVPVALKAKACICNRCIERYHQQQLSINTKSIGKRID